MGTIVAVAIGVIVAVIIVLVAINYIVKKKPISQETSPEDSETPPVQKKRYDPVAISDNLFALNIQLRKTDGMDVGLLQVAEGIIDALVGLGEKGVVKDMNERFPAEELTWEVTRIATHHFPELVQRYLNLSQADRTSQREKFYDSLTSMADEIREIEKIASSANIGEFSRKAKHIGLKYGKQAWESQ